MTDTLRDPQNEGTQDEGAPTRGGKQRRTLNGFIPIDAIDLDFVPVPLGSVASRVVGGETVLIDTASGTLHRLDPVGSVVWSTFDGSADLGVLAEELADAFGADREVVARDVVRLTRALARIGLLAGVARPAAHNHRPSEPVGVAVGEELPPFRLPDLDGATVDLADLRGGPVLLVNWSPGCGYCVMIAEELDGLRPALEERGVRLLLVAAGDAARNRALLDDKKLGLQVLLRTGAGDDFADPFPRMGTPAAYLLDADGRVAAPLVSGAYQVPGLARGAAGETTGVGTGAGAAPAAKYLPGASEGMCGPTVGTATGGGTKAPRTWTPTAAYRVGEYNLGVRADTPEAADIIHRFLAAHHAGADPSVPANYSVVLGSGALGTGAMGSGANGSGAPAGRSATGRAGGGKAARDLKILLQSSTTVVRSRSSRRVLLGLASFMASHLPGPGDGLLRTRNLAVVVDGEALMLPPAVRVAVEKLQPQLARFGAQLVDEPYATIDPAARQLVVAAPDLALDLAVLDELDEPAPSRSEPPRVAAGRYPLRAWTLWDSGDPEAPDLTPAEAVTQALVTVAGPPDQLPTAADHLTELFTASPPVVLASTGELANQLRPHLTTELPSSA